VSWFMREEFDAKASAHVVISDSKIAWMDALASDLPLVSALPVTVLQCRSPDTVSWHATWACDFAYGIEATNIGELRQQPAGSFNCWYPAAKGLPEWTTCWQGSQAIKVFGKWFCPWESKQVKAIVQVLRHAYAYYGSFQKSWILGHEQVQGNRTRKWDSVDAITYTTDKLDPGLHFPLEGVRESLFNGGVDVDVYPWFQRFSFDQEHYAVECRMDWVKEWANVGGKFFDDKAAFSAFQNEIHILPDVIEPFGAIGKLALRLLGYHVSEVTSNDLTNEDYQTICIFQRLMGLTTDCQPGIKTRQALFARLRDRGLIQT